MSDQQQPYVESHYCHAPMPYLVVLRAAMTDDAPVERLERTVVAYSLYEAIHAAVMEATGLTTDHVKFTIESVRPDVPAYLAMLLAQMRAKA
jgi:hypothetical protein